MGQLWPIFLYLLKAVAGLYTNRHKSLINLTN